MLTKLIILCGSDRFAIHADMDAALDEAMVLIGQGHAVGMIAGEFEVLPGKRIQLMQDLKRTIATTGIRVGLRTLKDMADAIMAGVGVVSLN